MWIAFFVMILLYVFMFFWMLRETAGEQKKDGSTAVGTAEEELEEKESRKMAYSMLL